MTKIYKISNNIKYRIIVRNTNKKLWKVRHSVDYDGRINVGKQTGRILSGSNFRGLNQTHQNLFGC